VRFPLAFRGYRMSEVDALLARLATELEERQGDEPGTEPGTEPDGPASSGEPPRV
jgi:DivIVA domain-containing protein